MIQRIGIVTLLGLLLLPLPGLCGELGIVGWSEPVQSVVKVQPAGKVVRLAKQGCCSWHGGVCGCSGGRVVCCDNTLSPSCTCRAGTVTMEN